ncbi:cysteine desulfurase [Lachnospiraceae bacterium KM106-2]|nr:cysteine desulfurase [Lachnospiraceae bacterium KM106-2]
MIYLDYAANTPVDPIVLDQYIQLTKDYIANPNSTHSLGMKAAERINESTAKIAQLLNVKPEEIIYTSGASESNNLAIKGIVSSYHKNGKHIISTGLEHSSVSGTLTYLQSIGYEIDLVDITRDGTVDMEHLKELLRNDTILVTIGYVDSELGVKQPIEEIGELLKQYPNCHFHTDGTQAAGKIPLNLDNVDCFTCAPHKFFGINGFGLLVKKEGVILEPIIHGGASTTIYRSGTPVLAMAGAMEKAMEIAFREQQSRYDHVKQLNDYLRTQFAAYKLVTINSTKESIPFTLNLSVKGVKSAVFQKSLDDKGIFVSTKSACSVPNTPSRAVYSVSHDRKNALASWRISMSHLTTKEEIDEFLKCFDACYNELT